MHKEIISSQQSDLIPFLRDFKRSFYLVGGTAIKKLFREQLAFHKDIDYFEPVRFVVEAVPDDEIKNFLIDKAIDLFE